MSIITKLQSADLAEKYENLLRDTYSDNLAALHKKEVMKLVEYPGNRGNYTQACHHLICMKRLGKSEEVQKLKEDFLIKYKNRHALLEELAQV